MKEFFEGIEKNSFQSPYLVQKWKVFYESPTHSVSFNVRVSLIKDSIILFSVSKLGFPVGKAVITPEEMAYYENWNKTFFKGSVSDVSSRLGLPLNFEQFQAVITGDSPVPVDKTWKISPSNHQEYAFEAITSSELVPQIRFTEFFKVFSEQIVYQNHSAQIYYKAYSTDKLPEKIFVDSGEFKLQIEIKKSTTGKKPEIRFNIPQNYIEQNL